jgi:RHS repeat-associated protein
MPLRFAGPYHDTETGLYYNYNRYYNPDTGRYITTDPLGLTPSPNPHTYVTNPTTTIDPLGLAKQHGLHERPTPASRMDMEVKRGQAPAGIERVDRGAGPWEKDHVHFKDGSALNFDGTWKHGNGTITNRQARWLRDHGWELPDDE